MLRDELARRIANALSPIDELRVVWLFGSRAAGTQTPRSDLDLAVVYAAGLDAKISTTYARSRHKL